MYTVTSSLKYRVARRYNGQKLICRAFNNAGSKETFLTLNVTCKLALLPQVCNVNVFNTFIKNIGFKV